MSFDIKDVDLAKAYCSRSSLQIVEAVKRPPPRWTTDPCPNRGMLCRSRYRAWSGIGPRSASAPSLRPVPDKPHGKDAVVFIMTRSSAFLFIYEGEDFSSQKEGDDTLFHCPKKIKSSKGQKASTRFELLASRISSDLRV